MYVIQTAFVKMLDLDNRLAAMIASDFRPVKFDLATAVTILKELAERGKCSAPTYDYWGPDALGYDQDGNPKWAVGCCTVNSETGIKRSVLASSKKDAKKQPLTWCFVTILRYRTSMGQTAFVLFGFIVTDSSCRIFPLATNSKTHNKSRNWLRGNHVSNSGIFGFTYFCLRKAFNQRECHTHSIFRFAW